MKLSICCGERLWEGDICSGCSKPCEFEENSSFNGEYDWPMRTINPCRCGYKPDHLNIYYGSTPYSIWCPHCKKGSSNARCLVTGHHSHAIDYWNSHIANLTLKQINAEVRAFNKKRSKAEAREGMRARQYNYYWEKGKGEVLYQRW